MAAAPPPAPPPITAIDLLQFSEIVDNARTDGDRGQNTGVVATANDGRPDVALKGSLMVWDADHLAWWERGRAETEAALRARIWERVVQVEKDAYPEKSGVAVLVRVDRVRAGKFDIQRR